MPQVSRCQSRSVWGRSWGLRRAYYDFLTLHGTDGGPEIGRPVERSLPTLHEVDFGVSWLGPVGSGLVEVRAELLHALGSGRVLDYSLRRTSSDGVQRWEEVPRRLPGRALLLSVRTVF